MNFEVFQTQEELEVRVQTLFGVAIHMITDFNGSVWTLKWS